MMKNVNRLFLLLPILAVMLFSGSQTVYSSDFTNSIGMQFNLIPAGSFTMGSDSGRDDEQPVHQVELTRPFYLGIYEVTQAQWVAVMGSNPSSFTGDTRRPVETVSWDDAQEFISQLNALEGTNKYRLPTEAEWEYACRAGSTGKWCFGDDESLLSDYAWYGESYYTGSTHPVGQLSPNDWGLYDMHGNVWEWCADWYDSDYYSVSPDTDPQGPSSSPSDQKVFRGGSWINQPNNTRSAIREPGPVDFRHHQVGFRVVKTYEVVTQPPIMGDVPDQNATVGAPFSLDLSAYVIQTDENEIVEYELTGTLPDGLSFDSTTGLLTGTPESGSEGSYALSARARDIDGWSNEDDFTLNVASQGTIVIDGCDTGVEDQLYEGQWISEMIDACAASATNHGEFVSCVADLTNELRRAGVITGAEKGAIQSCAAQADIP